MSFNVLINKMDKSFMTCRNENIGSILEYIIISIRNKFGFIILYDLDLCGKVHLVNLHVITKSSASI